MSRFFSDKYLNLKAYVPGEQPKDLKYIKLNTNESPFCVKDNVIERVTEAVEKIQLYSDPECTLLREKIAEIYGVKRENVVAVNGSDEALNFIFMAYGDDRHPFVFPDITYGFYPVFANINSVPYETIALDDDFSIDYKKYCGINKNVVIANPNAPTGMVLSLDEIREIAASNPDNIVTIDEAYVDFGAESAVKLINEFNNLIVTQTFSKSRSMAGARLGFAIASEELIRDLNTVRYSTNPYNVNSMTMAAGIAVLENNEFYMENCREIVRVRENTKEILRNMGFSVTESKANFLFAKSDKISGEELYLSLKEKGVLIRHFNIEKIKEYNRITIGTQEQMNAFVEKTKEILKERGAEYES